jgi:hypothetical protein
MSRDHSLRLGIDPKVVLVRLQGHSLNNPLEYNVASFLPQDARRSLVI